MASNKWLQTYSNFNPYQNFDFIFNAQENTVNFSFLCISSKINTLYMNIISLIRPIICLQRVFCFYDESILIYIQ